MKDKLKQLNTIAEEIGLDNVYYIEIHHGKIKLMITNNYDTLNELTKSPCRIKTDDGYIEIRSEKYPNVLFKMEAE